MRQVERQMPASAGRVAVGHGEAVAAPTSDETCGPRCETKGTGSGLLQAAVARERTYSERSKGCGPTKVQPVWTVWTLIRPRNTW